MTDKLNIALYLLACLGLGAVGFGRQAGAVVSVVALLAMVAVSTLQRWDKLEIEVKKVMAAMLKQDVRIKACERVLSKEMLQEMAEE